MRSPLLDAKDVAQRLNVSVRTAQRLMRTVPNINVCLGGTYDEAYSALSNLLALYDQDEGTTTEFQSRACAGGERLGDATTTTCQVKKKGLGGKQLEFFFSSGDKKAHTYLPKQVIKDFRQDLKFDKKLHPKQHK